MQLKQRGALALVAVLSALLVLAGACSPLDTGDANGVADATPEATPTATPTPDTTTTSPPSAPPSGALSTAELVEFVQPSVVRVAIPSGVGSGFVIDEGGYIITNYHVIENGLGQVNVTLFDGSVHDATVVGVDQPSDIAVLHIDAGSQLQALHLAALHDVAVGEDVVAIGFALDLAAGAGPPSVTRGIVSAKNRVIQPRGILGAVQTDAAINHGNSGGPLLNYLGEVVGVNTALAPDRGGGVAQNIGFSVGSDTVRAVYEEIREKGHVDRAMLGIQNFSSIRAAEARALNIPEDTRGIIVREGSVAPGGPAATAGLRAQDVIVRVGDLPVGDESDLAVAMIMHDPGEIVDVQVYRNGELLTLEVTLGAS